MCCEGSRPDVAWNWVMLQKIVDKFCATGGALHQQGEPVGPSSVEQAFGMAL